MIYWASKTLPRQPLVHSSPCSLRGPGLHSAHGAVHSCHYTASPTKQKPLGSPTNQPPHQTAAPPTSPTPCLCRHRELAIQLRRDVKPRLDAAGTKLFLVSIGGCQGQGWQPARRQCMPCWVGLVACAHAGGKSWAVWLWGRFACEARRLPGSRWCARPRMPPAPSHALILTHGACVWGMRRTGTWERSKEFAEVTDFPRELLLADPESVTYEALGLVKGVAQTFFSWQVIGACVRRGWRMACAHAGAKVAA